MKQGKANQSNITFFEKEMVIHKKYKENEINKLSSVSNEIACINKFKNTIKNNFFPEIIVFESKSYIMFKYSFPLGTSTQVFVENFRRVLFSIDFSEFENQMKRILEILKACKINHRDINPGNLMFCEKEKTFKLIDFYWAKMDGIVVGDPKGLNEVYGLNDEKAFKKIINECKELYKNIKKDIEETIILTKDFGKVRFDGSSKHIGKLYHKLNVPYFNNLPTHRDTSFEEANVILENTSSNIGSVIDFGCANGNLIFTLMRNLELEKAIGYEYYYSVFKFLSNMKKLFNLEELEVRKEVTPSTEFEKVNLILCMNVHMWLVKRFGKDADKIIENMIKNSTVMFFQTAGKESEGMYKLDYLDSKETIEKYLTDRGGKVEFIRTSTLHGGKRHLFKILGG